MFDFEAQPLPENYYSVDVAGLAEFVICASDEDFAYLRLREYCKENLFLAIDPDAHFEIFRQVLPVAEDDAAYFRKTQLGHNIVRLVGYTESATLIHTEPNDYSQLRIDASKQLELPGI